MPTKAKKNTVKTETERLLLQFIASQENTIKTFAIREHPLRKTDLKDYLARSFINGQLSILDELKAVVKQLGVLCLCIGISLSIATAQDLKNIPVYKEPTVQEQIKIMVAETDAFVELTSCDAFMRLPGDKLSFISRVSKLNYAVEYMPVKNGVLTTAYYVPLYDTLVVNTLVLNAPDSIEAQLPLLRDVIAHELLHVAGFDHSSRFYQTLALCGFK